MRHVSSFLTVLLALAVPSGSLTGCGGEPDAPRGDASPPTLDGGDGGHDGTSALPVRCPPGTMHPVCMPGGADNPVGSGPRPRAQVGLSPMLTGGVIDGGRLIVGGAWGGGAELAGAVLAIDLDDGDRAVLSGTLDDPRTGPSTIGAGPALGQVFDVGVRSDGDVVALVTMSTSRVELVRIDRASGDRTLLWYNELVATGHETSAACTDGAGREIPNVDPDSLAIGPDDAMYLVARPADPGAGAVVAVAASGTSCSIVSFAGTAQPPGAERGSGPIFTPGLRGLRYADGRVYGAQLSTSSVIAIDVASGDRVTVSSHSTSRAVGTGGELGFSRLAVDGDRLLTIDDATGGFTLLTEVDLATGDRAVVDLVSNTAHAPGEGGVWFHPSRPLYVSIAWRTSVVLIDPALGEANVMSN